MGVKVPLLCFLAEDDPLVPPHAFKHLIGLGDKDAPSSERVPLVPSSTVVIALTRRGGHCGWFQGLFGRSWIDDAIYEFLQKCVNGAGNSTHEKCFDASAVG